MRFILRNKEFDLKAKSLAFAFLYHLERLPSQQARHSLILNDIIENINALSNFEDQLLTFFNYLLPSMKENLPFMFHNILDVTERAKAVCLKSLLASFPDKADLKPDFEMVMKLRIMRLGYNEEIRSLCDALLNRIDYQDDGNEILEDSGVS